MSGFLADMKLTLVKAASAAGQTAVESDSVDMSGYDAALFFTTFGAITAGADVSIKVQQSSDDGDDDAWADLDDAAITVEDDDDGQVFGIEILRSSERYLRCVVSRATEDAVVGEVYALQYGADDRPITNTIAGTATFITVADPVEAE